MTMTAKGLVGCTLLLLVCVSVVAGELNPGSVPSVSDFLTPDGRFDLDKVRQSGYQGPLDAGELVFDSSSMNDEPRFKAASDPMDVYWQSVGSSTLPGLTSDEYEQPCVTVYDGKLIVAGTFHFAGSTPINSIAAWDGTAWSAMGNGLAGDVYSLAVYDNKLIAGGGFRQSGTVTVGSIAVWDGDSWLPFAAPVDGDVLSLLSIGDKLYASIHSLDPTPFNFRVEVWDGTNWSMLGNYFNANVHVLSEYQGKIVAAGAFATVGDVSVNCIAEWDGTAWNPLGAGVNRTVWTMIVFEGKLFVGGRMTEAGGLPTQYVAAWDGSNWIPMNLGVITTTYVRSLWVHDGELFAGGHYLKKAYLSKWNGVTWDPIPSGLSGEENFIFAMTSWSGKLIAAGSFSYPCNAVAAWDGTGWTAVGEGFLSYVRAVVDYNGRLVAADTYVKPGTPARGPVVEWDGTEWLQLGTGVNGTVTSLFRYGDKLIVSGNFDSAGGAPANHIAVWDGTNWSALGAGLDSAAVAYTRYGNRLIVGGTFTTAGGESRPYLAGWDGQNWSSVGDSPNGAISALTMYDSKLIAAGYFSAIGSLPIEWIAAWNGQAWTGVGSDIDGPYVRALQVYHDELIAVGTVGLAGAWNGQTWRPITGAEGFWREANSAAVHAGELLVGGAHSSGQYVMKWNGKTWSTLGSGVTGRVWSFASTDSALFLSGGFAYAGNVLRPYVAAWRVSSGCCTGSVGNIDLSVSETPDLTDLSLLIAYLTQDPRPILKCQQEANFNLSSTGVSPYVDLSDLSMMIAYLTISPRPPLLSCP